TEGVYAALHNVYGGVQGVVQVDVGVLGDVRFEHEAGATAQVQTQAHLTPLRPEEVDPLADADGTDAARLRPEAGVRQVPVGVRWPDDEEGEDGENAYEGQE